MKVIAEFLSALSCVQRVGPIGYHEYGSAKYLETGMVYILTNIEAGDGASL